MPVQTPRPGSPAALLEVRGSDVPDAVWDTVEKAIEALDRTDREHMQYKACGHQFVLPLVPSCASDRAGGLK